MKASICLYGERSIGFGWLGDLEGQEKIYGDVDPRQKLKFESMTACVWAACDEMLNRGATSVRLHMDVFNGLEKTSNYADVDIHNPPYFGQISWSQE